MSASIQRLKTLYRHYDRQAFDALGDVYSEDVYFEDPAHSIHGLESLRAYLARLAEGLLECRFAYHHEVIGRDSAAIEWTMLLRHRSLRGGGPVQVPGLSALRFGEKVHYHRDYFDMGALLYENVPLLGSVVGLVKRRM